jgi:hypothetical protein
LLQENIGEEKMSEESEELKSPASEEALEVASKELPKKVNLFERLENFRAGTFKFEPNQNYSSDLEQYLQTSRSQIVIQKQREGASLSEHQIQNSLSHKVLLERPQVKTFKKFVPLFPFLYDDLNFGMELACKMQLKLSSKNEPAGSLQTERVLNRVNLRFSIKSNLLLKHEETRPF